MDFHRASPLVVAVILEGINVKLFGSTVHECITPFL